MAIMQKDQKTKWAAAVIVAVIVVIALVFLTSVFRPSNSAASYQASVLGVTEVNTSTVLVKYRVTNKGTKSGSPLCTIEVGNQSSGFTGNNEFVLNETLGRNQSITASQDVVVSNSGAGKATSGTISCT